MRLNSIQNILFKVKDHYYRSIKSSSLLYFQTVSYLCHESNFSKADSLKFLCPGGVVDILEDCGSFDPGSSPGRGVFVLSEFLSLRFIRETIFCVKIILK
jgi:hypothetical protein